MFTFGSIPLTGGNGDYKVRSLKITITGVDYYWSGVSLLDGDGELLVGQKARAGSIPVALPPEDIAELVKLQGGRGWVTIPASNAAVLTTPVRQVVIASVGLLAVEAPDGTITPIPIPVQPGMVFVVDTVRFGPANTCAAVGVK